MILTEIYGFELELFGLLGLILSLFVFSYVAYTQKINLGVWAGAITSSLLWLAHFFIFDDMAGIIHTILLLVVYFLGALSCVVHDKKKKRRKIINKNSTKSKVKTR